MLKRIGAEESGEFKAVASGTLPSGRPVIVNADGTVTAVANVATSASAGTPVVFEAANVPQTSIVYDSSNDKTVVFYRDAGDSNKGKAIVGTVSGSSISFGTPVEFESGATPYIRATFDSSNNKVVIAYSDQDDSSYGKAIVGTVSGTSISFGSAVTFESASVGETPGICFDSTNNKVVISYRDSGNSHYGTAIVGTVSGTSISFGTATVFRSENVRRMVNAYDSVNEKVVIAYRSYSDGNAGDAIVGTVSGTSISFGSPTEFNDAVDGIGLNYDVQSGKMVVSFQDDGGFAHGIARVGTISGTSISFGTEVTYNAASTIAPDHVYDPTTQKTIIAYTDSAGSSYGEFVEGTVSGTSITFSSPTNFSGTNGAFNPTMAYDTTAKKIVVAYDDGDNNNYGTAAVATVSGNYPNLTSENYIGMSRGVAFQTGEAGSTGTAVSFESGTTNLSHVAFDSSNNKVVIAYVDGGDSDKGKAIVGTVSGTSISFGSIVQFEAGNTANLDNVFDSSNNKIVILFQDNGDSGRGKGIVGTVSGTSISFGSPTQFNSGANNAYNIAAAFDSSNNKVVVAYRDNGNSDYGTAAVGTVSGTSISFGTPVVFQSSNSQQQSVVFDSSNNKIVIGYRDSGASDIGKAIVGTVSGTSISFGTAATFNNAETSQLVGTFDSSNNKVVFAYRDNGNSDQGTAIVGTVSGTSISFGSEVIFNTGNTQGTSAVFDTNVNKVVISYEDRGDSDIGKFIVGTVSGTSISFDTETAFSGSNAVFQTGAAFDSNANKVVIAYANDTHSDDRGEAIVTSLSTIATTRGEVANSGNASVDVIGSVSDNQIGLTAGQQYFVQTDGTISTTAGSPSVLAGTAISATELVVKT